MNKATYDESAKTKFTSSHRKEGKCFFNSYQIVDLDAPTHRDHIASIPVELRLYGTGNQNFACLWVHLPGNTKTGNPFPNGLYTSGSGRAGGYGYHRPSAAAHVAINNAGFALEHAIDGVGDTAIETALCAIAECIGIKNYALVRSHP